MAAYGCCMDKRRKTSKLKVSKSTVRQLDARHELKQVNGGTSLFGNCCSHGLVIKKDVPKL